jgi:putative FmdB family regulatory protein
MPLYEYVCRKCHKTFSEVLTIKEHETKKVDCRNARGPTWEKSSSRSSQKPRARRGYRSQCSFALEFVIHCLGESHGRAVADEEFHD